MPTDRGVHLRSRARAAGAPLLAIGDLVAGLPRPPAWAGVTVVVAFLSWPAGILPPLSSNNIDVSWITALHVAAHEGLRFGPDFNFVYGPLGYVTFANLFYDDTGLVAATTVAAIYLTSVGLVTRAGCRSFGILGGALIAFLVARIALSPMDRVELLPGMLVALVVLGVHRAHGSLPAWQGFAIGVLAAFCELVKFSVGSLTLAVVAVLVLIALFERDRPRSQRIARAWPPVAGAAVGLVGLWLLAGETLWDLAPYLRNSIDLVNGNVDALALEAPGLRSEYWYAALAGVALAAAVFLDGRRLAVAPRLGLAAVWFGFTYVSFRHGFTNHVPGHAAVFFAPLLLAAAATFPITSGRTVALLACAPLVAGIWSVGHLTKWGVLRTSTDSAVTHLELTFSASKRHTMQRDTIASLRKTYGFTPELIDRLRGQTVHFDPWEASIAWAYQEFDWRPAPVVQPFSAYTERLDRLNADFLAGERAPRFVLREHVVAFQRNARFESPAYQFELLCRYRGVLTTKRWQLLERGSSRCGRPQPLGSRRVRFGERVQTPQSDGGIVTASFRDFELPLSDRVKESVFKGRSWWINPAPEVVNRFVKGHAASPHVMVVPPCLDWSRSLFESQPFNDFAIGWMPGADSGQIQEPSYAVSFERVPFRCPRAAG